MAFWETPGGAAAITTAAGLAGAALGSDYSGGANKMNRKTMYRQFRLNKAMRSTAVQDRVADLRAAGINPILAGRYSADTPAASVLSAIDPSQGASNIGALAANTARSALMVGAERDRMVSETIRILGETSKGQWLINEIGGAEKLSRLLEANPDVAEKVAELTESQPFGFVEKIFNILMGEDGTDSPNIPVDRPGRTVFDYWNHFKDSWQGR